MCRIYNENSLTMTFVPNFQFQVINLSVILSDILYFIGQKLFAAASLLTNSVISFAWKQYLSSCPVMTIISTPFLNLNFIED